MKTYLEHEYKPKEQEHVDYPEYGHAVACDADDKQHYDHDVDPVACARGFEEVSQNAEQPWTAFFLALCFNYWKLKIICSNTEFET